MADSYRGRVLRTPFVTRELAVYAAMLPVGTAVRHISGWTGIVREDNADHVPGIHLGEPTAHCLANEEGSSVLVCISVNNASRLPWVVWVALEAIERTGADRANKPALAVNYGRRHSTSRGTSTSPAGTDKAATGAKAGRGRSSVAPATTTLPASSGTPTSSSRPTGDPR